MLDLAGVGVKGSGSVPLTAQQNASRRGAELARFSEEVLWRRAIALPQSVHIRRSNRQASSGAKMLA